MRWAAEQEEGADTVRATGRRVSRIRRPLLVLALLTVWVLLVGRVGTVDAAFSGRTTNSSNALTADVLDRTGSFSASRPCTPLTPAYRDSTSNTTFGSSSLTLTTPTTAAGDMLVMSVLTYNGGAVPTITTPTDWDPLGSNFVDGSNIDLRLAVFTRTAPASPPGNYVVSFSTSAAAVATLTSYSHVGSRYAWSGDTGTSTTATVVGLPTGGAGQLLVGVFGRTGSTSSTPAGMTLSASANGTGAGLREFHELRTVAGDTGNRTMSIDATNPAWGTRSVVLPSAGAGYDPTVNLSWTVTPDTWATGYEIRRVGGPTTAVSGRSTVAWSDTSTASGTGYTYTITAAYGGWRSATRSATVTAC